MLKIISGNKLENRFTTNLDEFVEDLPSNHTDMRWRTFFNKPVVSLTANPSYQIKESDNSFDFILTEKSKILVIENALHLWCIFRKYSEDFEFRNKKGTVKKFKLLNWEKLEEDFDSVFIKISNLSKYTINKYHLNYYDNKDTLFVFNVEDKMNVIVAGIQIPV